MSANDLQRQIDRARRRATELGVDELIPGLWFDHFLRHYASWSKKAEYKYSCISEAREPVSGRLDLTLFGKAYSIRTKDELSDEELEVGEEDVRLQVWHDERLVFEQLLRTCDREYFYSSRFVAAFIEGEWIIDFRRLETEAKAAEERRERQGQKDHAVEEAARFGIPSDRAAALAGVRTTSSPELAKGVVAATGIGLFGLFLLALGLLAVLGVIGLLVFGLRQIL